jgi:serine/threonine-protein kinase
VVVDFSKVVKALPGVILLISLLFIMRRIGIQYVLSVVALFIISYELFRKYPLKDLWLLIQVMAEVVMAISMVYLIIATGFYDAIAVFLGLIVLMLSLRVADVRALLALLSIYVAYLLYMSYVNPIPTGLYIIANSLLLFMSSFTIAIRNVVIMHRIDFTEDVLDTVITYLGVSLLIPSAYTLLALKNPYLYITLVPAVVSVMPMVKRYAGYIAIALTLLTLMYGLYPLLRLTWVSVVILVLIFVVMYLRPTRLRFIRGLRPPLSWLGAWLGGKYLVDSIIAMGGFSYVLRGRDELNRVYAIKVLKDRDSRGNQLASDMRVLSSFKKEMSEYLLIDSPYIVKVFEVHIPPDGKIPYKTLEDYLDEPPYVIMEYMEGGSLRDLLRERGPLDLREFLKIAYAITLALSELHKANILHLDLKPENILFKDKDRKVLKLGDLGAAKIMVSGKSYVSQFSIAYAAPEVSKGIADVRSDIYSLSCIFYEMLTGINPHLYRLSSGQLIVPPISNYRPDVPPELASMIMRGLEVNPSLRPSNTDEVLAVLSRLLQSLG